MDRYQVCGEIDCGGMAVVYAVKRAGTGGFSKLLAMKIIMPHLAREDRFRSMFLDEARILSLIDHPNVVQVQDVGETPDGLIYMVMELLRGRSMSKLVKAAFRKDGHMPRHLLFSILADAAEGLHAAHETKLASGEPAKIVHRDVSPQNIHVGFEGAVKVMDFGIAAAAGRTVETQTGEVKGKLAFMAPEQIMRRGVDRRADIWALGVLTWEILAGRRLFAGATDVETIMNVDTKVVPPIDSITKGLPRTASETIMCCLERDPGKRPPTARHVAEVFREAEVECRAPKPGAHKPRVAEERPPYVQRLLEKEAEDERERYQAALDMQSVSRQQVGSPDDDEISAAFAAASGSLLAHLDEPTQTQARPTPRPQRRWWLPALLVAGSVAAAVAAYVVAAPPPHTPRRPRPQAVTRPSGSTELPAPPESVPTAPTGTRTIRLEIDPRLNEVRVAGEIVAERPALVRLAARESPEVEASGPGGLHASLTLGPDSPDVVVLRPEPTGPVKLPKKAGTYRPGQTKTKQTGGIPTILDSPYQHR